MVIFCCIDTWEGELMVMLDIICLVCMWMKKGSMCNHQSSQDWNDLEVAYASRIEPDVIGMIILYPFCTSQHRFLLMRYQVCVKIQKILIEDPEQKIIVPWSIFGSLSPWSPGKAQFISQIVKIAHKIQNCVYITSILSFHLFVSFWAILVYHNQSSTRGI